MPNSFNYGDAGTAYESASKNGGTEWLEVGFDTPVHATGVTVRETEGNGYVTQIDVLDTSDALHTVWTGTDPSPKGVVSPAYPASTTGYGDRRIDVVDAVAILRFLNGT